MNTVDMWKLAQSNSNLWFTHKFNCGVDIYYNAKHWIIDQNGHKWNLSELDTLTNPFKNLMEFEWTECKVLSVHAAEEKYGIKIIKGFQ